MHEIFGKYDDRKIKETPELYDPKQQRVAYTYKIGMTSIHEVHRVLFDKKDRNGRLLNLLITNWQINAGARYRFLNEEIFEDVARIVSGDLIGDDKSELYLEILENNIPEEYRPDISKLFRDAGYIESRGD